jgi:zinc and cadmium transporter
MSLALSLVSVLGISLISFVGVFTFAIKENLIKKYIFLFVSLAVGALLGDAFIHLIPEGLEEISNPLIFSLLIISGIMVFFIIEKFIHWHHHCDIAQNNCENKPMGKMILLSDAMHNFINQTRFNLVRFLVTDFCYAIINKYNFIKIICQNFMQKVLSLVNSA